MKSERFLGWQHIPMLVLVAGAVVSGCEDQAGQIVSTGTDTTICLLLKATHEVPGQPQFGYTIEFTYDSEGRVDSAVYASADAKTVTKFFYSIDENPDYVIRTSFAPSPNPGFEYRIDYSYDSNRRLIVTALPTGDTIQYTYNSHGQLIRRDREFFLNGVHVVDTVWFSYPDNVTRNFSSTIARSHTGQLLDVPTFYFYDNHPRPLKLPMNAPVTIDYGFSLGLHPDNNLLKTTSNGMEQVKNTYTYNEAGYPLVQTDALAPQQPQTMTFTYHCETIEKP